MVIFALRGFDRQYIIKHDTFWANDIVDRRKKKQVTEKAERSIIIINNKFIYLFCGVGGMVV